MSTTTNSPTNYTATVSDTIGDLPDRPKMSAAALKALFDKVSDDNITTQYNAFLAALASGSVALPVSGEDGTLTAIELGDALTADGKYAVTSAAIYAALKNVDKVCWATDLTTYAGIKNAVDRNQLVVYNPGLLYICASVTDTAATLVHFHGLNSNGKLLLYVRTVTPNTTIGGAVDTTIHCALTTNEPLNAVYGVTPYAAIAEAWGQNRVVKCRVNNAEYYCSGINSTSTANQYVFTCIRGDNASTFHVSITEAGATVYDTPTTKYIRWTDSDGTSSDGNVEYIDFGSDSYERITELVAANKALFGEQYGRTYSYGGIDDNSRHTFVSFKVNDVAQGAMTTNAIFYRATCDISNQWEYSSFSVAVTPVH